MSETLIELQASLQAHVLGRGDATALIRPDGASSRERLGIYVDAYRIRLADTLADAYAKTQSALGDARFERACLRYIDAHTPTTRSLRWYGGHFADRLAEWAPASPHWSELARLEWALRHAFDGADAPVLAAEALSALPPEAWASLRFALHPTAALLTFEHNPVAVWQALDDDEVPPDWQRGERAVTWLVWRKGLQPHFRSLSPFEAGLLGELLQGRSFASACASSESLAQPQDNPGGDGAAVQIGGCLRQWVQDELLSGMVFDR